MQHKSLLLYPEITVYVSTCGRGHDGEKFGCIVDARENLVLVDTSITPVPPCVVSVRYIRAVG